MTNLQYAAGPARVRLDDVDDLLLDQLSHALCVQPAMAGAGRRAARVWRAESRHKVPAGGHPPRAEGARSPVAGLLRF